MKAATLFCLLAALFVGSNADMCLSRPSNLGRGSACNYAVGGNPAGNSLACQTGLFCSKEGICVPEIKEGGDCEDAVCAPGLQCKGPTDYLRCVAAVHPGKDCTNSASQSGPHCGTGACISGRCRGGNLGDACFENDDCSGDLTCTEGICTGVAIGSNASSTDSCVIGAYRHSETGKCTALPSSGNCTEYNDCAHGYWCTTLVEDAPYPQCFATYSIADGEYCQDDAMCESGRCYANHCASKSAKYCDPSGCAEDEVCACGGATILIGYGTCKTDPCSKHHQAYDDCLAAHCRSSNYFEGSCIELNCRKEYLRSFQCGSASSLAVSFFAVSFLALFASFFGKHF